MQQWVPSNTADGEFEGSTAQLTQIDPLVFVSKHNFTTGRFPRVPQLYLDQIDTMTLPDNHQLELHIICDDGIRRRWNSNDYDIDILNLPVELA